MTPVAGWSPTPWARLVSPPHPAPAVRLFCFPYAGAGASVYGDWTLPDQLSAEVWAIQPPGRETRRSEQVITELDPLLEACHRDLAPLLDRPYAFFGHSIGALVAFELTRLLRRRGDPLPGHLFLSGHRAPHRPLRREPISSLPDDRFVARMREIAGSSPSAIRDRELLLLFAPVTRADCRLGEQYTYTLETALPPETWMTCFAADDDSEFALADVGAWEEHAGGGFRLNRYHGGHLFLRDHTPAILAEIATDLVLTATGTGRPPGVRWR